MTNKPKENLNEPKVTLKSKTTYILCDAIDEKFKTFTL